MQADGQIYFDQYPSLEDIRRLHEAQAEEKEEELRQRICKLEDEAIRRALAIPK